MSKSIYRISLNIGPGVYFLPASFDPALKRGRRLNGAGVYNDGTSRTRTTAYLHVWVMRLMASQGSSDSSFEKASVIRGHHINKSI